MGFRRIVRPSGLIWGASSLGPSGHSAEGMQPSRSNMCKEGIPQGVHVFVCGSACARMMRSPTCACVAERRGSMNAQFDLSRARDCPATSLPLGPRLGHPIPSLPTHAADPPIRGLVLLKHQSLQGGLGWCFPHRTPLSLWRFGCGCHLGRKAWVALHTEGIFLMQVFLSCPSSPIRATWTRIFAFLQRIRHKSCLAMCRSA